MYYFELYKLYDPKHLSKAYRALARRARAAKASLFPTYLTAWIMALLGGCFSAAYNIFFYRNFDESAASFPVPVLSELFGFLGKYIQGNFFLMFLGGFVFVSLVPLVIGLAIRLVLSLPGRLVIRMPSQKGMSAQEKLQQMRKFCDIISKEHDYSQAMLLFPVLGILGTAAGIMYAMYLDDPTLADSAVWEWILAGVVMILFGVLLCLLHIIYFMLNFSFFKPLDRSDPLIVKAIESEEQRLEKGEEPGRFYEDLRTAIERQKEGIALAKADIFKRGPILFRHLPSYKYYRRKAWAELNGFPVPEYDPTSPTGVKGDNPDDASKDIHYSGTLTNGDYHTNV